MANERHLSLSEYVQKLKLESDFYKSQQIDWICNFHQLKSEQKYFEWLLAYEMIQQLEKGSTCFDVKYIGNENFKTEQSEISDYLSNDEAEWRRGEVAQFWGTICFFNKWLECEKSLFNQVQKIAKKNEPLKLSHHCDSLNEDQYKAVQNILSSRLSALCGGAGTGKTYTTVRILIELITQHKISPSEIAVVAPTGKAVARLQESFQMALSQNSGMVVDGVAFKTIHRLLESHFDLGFRRNAERRLKQKWIFVDEASMLDLEIARAFFEALPSDVSLLFIGDPAQLPAVGKGAFFKDLIEYSKVNQEVYVHQLKSGQRSTAELSKFAQQLYLKSEIKWSETPVNHLDIDDGELLKHLVKRWQECLDVIHRIHFKSCHNTFYLSNDLKEIELIFVEIEKFKVISVLRASKLGCDFLNQKIAEKLNPQNPTLVCGAPIQIKENDYQQNLYNGDVGILAFYDVWGAWFAYEDTFRFIPLHSLPLYEWGFVTTVHKAQGSEWQEVLLVLPSEDNELLTQEILYTAVTRAKQKFLIHGSLELFELGRKKIATRTTVAKSLGFKFDKKLKA